MLNAVCDDTQKLNETRSETFFRYQIFSDTESDSFFDTYFFDTDSDIFCDTKFSKY